MCKMYDVCTNSVLGQSDHETVETIFILEGQRSHTKWHINCR